MADGVVITCEGLPQFDRMMIELAGPSAEKASRQALRAGDVPAHPYIRPAFEANEGLAIAAMDETIATEITAAAKRNGG